MAKRVTDYRPDVDGLRALAVVAVLLFHAKLGCPGGFVGVDIFFVISGFLISSLILKEIAKGSFTLINFWERRIRRILPAVVVVIFATLVAGWFLYLPDDFLALGKSALAQVALVSNVFFYRQAGYFEAGADTKPLLHTWSLAVEEQFYLLYPFFLVCLVNQKRLGPAAGIAVVGISSLVLSVVGTYTHAWATFYLLPTRAWELLLGAWLVVMRDRFSAGKLPREVAGWIGLALIYFPLFCYDADTRFPGLAAVPPCLGTALIIYSSQTGLSMVGRLFSLRPLVFIGLISYSLYLWHWPLLVYANYVSAKALTVLQYSLLLGLSVLLAAASWKYIETPFRRRMVFQQRRQVYTFAGTSIASLSVVGLWIIWQQGVPSRLSVHAQRLANARYDRAFLNETTLPKAAAGQFFELGGQPTNQPVEIVIWGDSHAMAVTPVIDELCRRHSKRGVQVTVSATAPLLDYVSKEKWSLREKSPEFASAVVNYIATQRVRNVILAANWHGYPPDESFKNGLFKTARSLMGAGARVFILQDVPKPKFDVPRIAAITAMRHGDTQLLGNPAELYKTENASTLQILDELSREGAVILDPTSYFINSNGLYGVVKDGNALFCDTHHLSVAGARLLSPLFEPIFCRE
ncbi:MAG TPA: acyltransferase family protein [Candidatus Paceibacterota bacterium]|nr:acyltransferase family protein [Candidatus Paceibacterota bacterium]